MPNDPEISSSSAEKTEPRQSSSAPERIVLARIEDPREDVEVTRIKAQSIAVRQALMTLGVTIVVGAIAMVVVDLAGHPVDAIREVFLAIGTGEIGLIAGLQRGP